MVNSIHDIHDDNRHTSEQVGGLEYVIYIYYIVQTYCKPKYTFEAAVVQTVKKSGHGVKQNKGIGAKIDKGHTNWFTEKCGHRNTVMEK